MKCERPWCEGQAQFFAELPEGQRMRLCVDCFEVVLEFANDVGAQLDWEVIKI